MRMRIFAMVALVAVSIAGCGTSESGDAGKSVAVPPPATTTGVAPNSKDALKAAAHQLDLLATQGDAADAYEFYSQRCKGIIGDLDNYKAVLAEWHKTAGGSQPAEEITVKVNGSSGQVVSVSSDPNASADSMEPRTWTFIDGRWQFDNC